MNDAASATTAELEALDEYRAALFEWESWRERVEGLRGQQQNAQTSFETATSRLTRARNGLERQLKARPA